MTKKKRKVPRLADVIRLGSILAEVVRALLDAERGDLLRLTIDLKRVGPKPWNLKPTGDAKVEVINPETAITAVDNPALPRGEA
jgi:hypothetical protein